MRQKHRVDIIPVERIQQNILLIRGQKVIIDSDLAGMYGVSTGRLNEQVKRNIDRFPQDFMFQLTKEEFDNLISHFATSRSNWGGRRKLPYVFTEHGALMAGTILKTEKAVQMSLFIVRAFVQLRRFLESNHKLATKFFEIEKHLQRHDQHIASIANIVNQLMSSPEKPKSRIGYLTEAQGSSVKKKKQAKRKRSG